MFNERALNELADRAFSDDADNQLRETFALVASLDGHIVFERYAEGYDRSSTFISWSMAKSVASALCGVLVDQGRLELDAPAPVGAWAGDERSAITLRQLLQMRSGLDWNEDYVDDQVSNVIEMLFGSGKADAAGYAAAQPLSHEPGSHWQYSSGTTNIITRLMSDAIGGGQPAFHETLVDKLLVPAGMTNPIPKYDDAGTWIGSSFLYATARDFVAFGELFRNDGIGPNGDRVLPEGWVEASVEDQATCPETGQGYGLQWWLTRDGHGSYSANGYEGQRTQVSPDLGLTFVRLGKTSDDHGDALRSFYANVTNCFI